MYRCVLCDSVRVPAALHARHFAVNIVVSAELVSDAFVSVAVKVCSGSHQNDRRHH